MKNWYIVQTFSGFEQKVANTLKESIKSKELNEKISDVLVPIHEVTEVKRGKRVQRKKKFFPSYVKPAFCVTQITLVFKQLVLQ